jgi:AraC family transcriptional regulator
VNYLKQVQAGIDHIEANLDFDLEISEVANAAGLSQWHFQRIFKALTNETIKTYIRSRRLALSLDKLLTTQARILDIALAAGYESQEAFSRAFKLSFGITPNEYRKLGDKSLFLRKVGIDEDYLLHINQNLSLEPSFVEQAPMVLVGLSTRFYSVDSDKNNMGEHLPALWAQFMSRVGEVEHKVGDVLFGVVRQIRADTDQLEYFAAAQVSVLGVLPHGMVATEIPAANYAQFWHSGLPMTVDHTVNYIYSNWLLGSGRRHTGGPDLEIYGAEYTADCGGSRFRYAIPID